MQLMARTGAERALAPGAPGFITFTSDVRECTRFFLHELELLGAAPVRVVLHLVNGARVYIRQQVGDASEADVARASLDERLRLAALARGRDLVEHCYHAGRAKELDDACIALASAEVPA